LFDKLCKKQTLWQAWLEVKKKNTAGGIDNVCISDFEKVADAETDFC